MDCSLPGSSVHGILQARILEGVAMPSSRGSSLPRDPSLSPLLYWKAGFFLFCFVLPLAPPGKRKANPGIASGVRLNWPGSNQFPPTSSVHFQRQKLELMKITYSSKWSLIEVGSVLYITGRDEPGIPPSHGHSGGGSLSWQKLKERRQLSKQLGREQWILFEGLNRGWNFLFSVLKGSQFPS